MPNSKYLAQIDIQAAEGEKPQVTKIKGVAYSGADILQWQGRMVVDLAGMEFAPQIPLMNSHWNTTDDKLGEVTAKVEDNLLLVDGAITSQSERAKQIASEGKLSKWQLSIGATILAQKPIVKGEKATVNGNEFEGPILVVTKSRLREVSVVAIGADRGASMEIAASLDVSSSLVTNPENKGSIQMDPKNENAVNAANQAVQPTEPVQASQPVAGDNMENRIDAAQVAADAIKAERQRVAQINAVCGEDCKDIAAKAIAEGWDINQVNAKCLEAVRASRPKTGININTGVKAIDKQEIECALALRAGVSGDMLAKSYDERTVDAAMSMCDISLKEVVHECIRLSGGTPSSRVGMTNEDIRAAFSTASLPGILGNVANKVMLKAYNAVAPVAFKLCSVGNLNDFKETDRYRMTDLGDLEKVGPDGEIKDGGLTEEGAKNKLETFGKKFCLTRKMIIDDDLGAFTKIPAMMGTRANKLVDKLFFARLQANPTQADGNALFSAAHNNYVASSGGLAASTLKNAISIFEKQKDASGEPIAVSPRTLLVPTDLKFLAKELLHSALLMTRGTTDGVMPSGNVLVEEDLEIVSSPYLTSSVNWWLFANPNECDTFEIGFLKGKRTPTIEHGDTDFNTLGMWFRVYFDLGVREQDFRGMVQSNG